MYIRDSSDNDPSEASSEDGSENARDLARGIGSLSIDDSHDVRYHGKASGLHLLVSRKGKETPRDRRSVSPESATSRDPNSTQQITTSPDSTDPSSSSKANVRERGGLWHFPPPGLWPHIDPSESHGVLLSNNAEALKDEESKPQNASESSLRQSSSDSDAPRRQHRPVVSKDISIPYLEERSTMIEAMPKLDAQRVLINLFFAHVHPVLPIIDRDEFFQAWEEMSVAQYVSAPRLTVPSSDHRNVSHSADNKTQKANSRESLSHALLFAIFAVASRFLDEDLAELPKGSMWTAGLAYSSMTRHILCEWISCACYEPTLLN